MVDRMRLLFIVTQADWGGVQSYIARAADKAIGRGFEVLVAAGGQGELESRCRNSSIPYHRLQRLKRKLSPGMDLMAVFELISLMRRWRPDIAYLHSSKAGVLGSIAAKLSRVPRVVYRIGGWSFLDPVSRSVKLFRLWSEKLTAGLKDVIITVHPNDERLAREMGFRAREAIVTIPNGLDLVAFDASLRPRDESRQILSEVWRNNVVQHVQKDDEHGRIVLTVANFYPTKNLLEYLEAIAYLRERMTGLRFVIIGSGDERAALLEKRRILGLEDVVAFPGRRDDVSTLLRGADLFVLPSAKEGMPWTVLEAMAAGVPCVATDVGASRWMLGDAGTIVPSHDPQVLASAIIASIQAPEHLPELGRRSRRIVERHFTDGAMWEATFAVLGR